jgi:hypothetical protein
VRTATRGREDAGLKAAIGLRAHSGWAAAVTVAGSRSAIEVLDRRRIELGDPSASGPKQPYHEAEGQPLPAARRIIDRYAEDAARRAKAAFASLASDLDGKGYEVFRCGLLMSSSRALPELPSILASHALIHSADGELFRDALARAASREGWTIVKIAEKELSANAAAALRAPASELQNRVQIAGKSLGPPWTQDQKLATLAAWVVLAASSKF